MLVQYNGIVNRTSTGTLYGIVDNPCRPITVAKPYWEDGVGAVDETTGWMNAFAAEECNDDLNELLVSFKVSKCDVAPDEGRSGSKSNEKAEGEYVHSTCAIVPGRAQAATDCVAHKTNLVKLGDDAASRLLELVGGKGEPTGIAGVAGAQCANDYAMLRWRVVEDNRAW